MSDWLMSMIEPILARVMVSLGVGYITFESITQIFDGVVSSMQNAMSTIPPAVMQVATMYGIPEGLGIILGGISFSLTLISLKRFRLF